MSDDYSKAIEKLLEQIERAKTDPIAYAMEQFEKTEKLKKKLGDRYYILDPDDCLSIYVYHAKQDQEAYIAASFKDDRIFDNKYSADRDKVNMIDLVISFCNMNSAVEYSFTNHTWLVNYNHVADIKADKIIFKDGSPLFIPSTISEEYRN